MNKIFLLGKTTKDIELKKTQNEKEYIKFTLAVRRNQKETDFISCQAWDKKAEFIQKYFGKKGSQIALTGRLQTGNYDDGEGKRIYTTDVVVEEAYFVGKQTEQKEEIF